MEEEHIDFLSLLLELLLRILESLHRNRLVLQAVFGQCHRKQNHLGILVQDSQLDRLLILTSRSRNSLISGKHRLDVLHKDLNITCGRLTGNDITIGGFVAFVPLVSHNHHGTIRFQRSKALTIRGLNLRIGTNHRIVLVRTDDLLLLQLVKHLLDIVNESGLRIVIFDIHNILAFLSDAFSLPSGLGIKRSVRSVRKHIALLVIDKAIELFESTGKKFRSLLTSIENILAILIQSCKLVFFQIGNLAVLRIERTVVAVTEMDMLHCGIRENSSIFQRLQVFLDNLRHLVLNLFADKSVRFLCKRTTKSATGNMTNTQSTIGLVRKLGILLAESVVIELWEYLELQTLLFVNAQLNTEAIIDTSLDSRDTLKFHLDFIDKSINDIRLVKTNGEFRSNNEVVSSRIVCLNRNFVSCKSVSLESIAAAEIHHDGVRQLLSTRKLCVLDVIESGKVDDSHLVTDAVLVVAELL